MFFWGGDTTKAPTQALQKPRPQSQVGLCAPVPHGGLVPAPDAVQHVLLDRQEEEDLDGDPVVGAIVRRHPLQLGDALHHFQLVLREGLVPRHPPDISLALQEKDKNKKKKILLLPVLVARQAM